MMPILPSFTQTKGRPFYMAQFRYTRHRRLRCRCLRTVIAVMLRLTLACVCPRLFLQGKLRVIDFARTVLDDERVPSQQHLSLIEVPVEEADLVEEEADGAFAALDHFERTMVPTRLGTRSPSPAMPGSPYDDDAEGTSSVGRLLFQRLPAPVAEMARDFLATGC